MTAVTVESLPDDPESPHDPRWAYDLTKESAFAAWPCGECGVRRGEHADQRELHEFPTDKFPDLDITDHTFVEPS